MRRASTPLRAASIAAALLVAGCTMARMAVPPQLAAQAQEMRVAGNRQLTFRNTTLTFGPYTIADIRHGWTETTAVGVHVKKLDFRSSQRRQRYQCTLAEPGGRTWRVQCATGVRKNELTLGPFSRSTLEAEITADTLFVCDLLPSDGAKPWKLIMEQGTGDAVLNGVLGDGTTQVRVVGTRKLAGGAWPLTEATGYHFASGGQTLGAVEVINAGAVWLVPSAPQPTRSALAAAASALLLYRDLRK
ncbi:hypothetical protein HQ576_13695 [bacterium]|nr:hypothetical protein [bacterium]